MIIGSGLIGQAFSKKFQNDDEVCIYAAGVSDSKCNNVSEFKKDEQRLVDALSKLNKRQALIYFGTCSIYSPVEKESEYAQHKLKMEKIVQQHNRHLIFRLSQVVGKARENGTLINFLYQKIKNEESFDLWTLAKRNLIDVEDIVEIVSVIIQEAQSYGKIYDIANEKNISIIDLVTILEKVLKKNAKPNFIDKGDEYIIDTSKIRDYTEKLKIHFLDHYEERIIQKYYGENLS